MQADHPLDRPSGRRPVAGDDRAPVPIHRGRELGFVDRPGREYWWGKLHPSVRTRLLEQVGDILEWWAYVYDDQPDRPYAVVLGRRGFALTKPSINERGKPASRLLVWSLREEPRRSTPVTGQTAGLGVVGDASNQPRTSNLPAHFRGFIGNLPAQAQRQLQAPFAAGDLVRECDHHYYGFPERFDFWCYLAGSRHVTFAAGTGLRDPGGSAFTWDLSCWEASVAGNPR